jgi:hypothetical protein
MDERSQHEVLVELKDGWDAGGSPTKIEIVKANAGA